MSRFRSLIYLLPELWRTLLTRPITVRFPFAPLELPPYFRGKVTIDPALCVGCGLCVRDCPAAALDLELQSRDKLRLIYYQDRCAYCGQCETSCPTKAIVLTNEFASAAADRRALHEEFAKDSGK
jgi:formate hydrogenlyase subunit 6/NADH:ubiquinone oxidoreductase subunit I